VELSSIQGIPAIIEEDSVKMTVLVQVRCNVVCQRRSVVCIRYIVKVPTPFIVYHLFTTYTVIYIIVITVRQSIVVMHDSTHRSVGPHVCYRERFA